MKKELAKLLSEYKETEKGLELGLEYVDEKDYGKGKLEIVKMIIADLEKVLEA
ncbi:hypothetical protein [Desnuesiella massiliensis]|uniref:hypothetical protein n=1 Tax=Desnuesiella massiliensis TaxID=1650662 RepID=UPI0018A7FC8E|nr:hypothetical protein [Desnuesiella massiliensis]